MTFNVYVDILEDTVFKSVHKNIDSISDEQDLLRNIKGLVDAIKCSTDKCYAAVTMIAIGKLCEEYYTKKAGECEEHG